jgi:hypothetical protein
MRAEELRIGNWVEYFGKIRKIDGIKAMSIGGYAVEIIETDIHGRSISEYSPLESLNLKPIPLTEECLVRFGFEYIDYYNNYRIIAGDYYNSVQLRDGEWLYNGDISDAECYGIREIKYVHTLQNLYHALNDEELTLNETI